MCLLLSQRAVLGQAAPHPKGAAQPPLATGDAADRIPGLQPGTERWIVRFDPRSLRLEKLRRVLHAATGPASIGAVDRIVAGYERTLRTSRRAFAAALGRMGGRLVRSWWLVNASLVELPPSRLAELRKLDGVLGIEPDRRILPDSIPTRAWAPLLEEATSGSAHNADAAHAAGYTGLGGRPAGRPMSIAVVDTEIKVKLRTRPAGVRHHGVLHVGGTPAGKDRVLADYTARFAINFTKQNRLPFDHGVPVAAVAAGAKGQYGGADDGQAPGAQIVGINVSNNNATGAASLASLADAWQWIVANRVRYNIAVAVNSYGGLPNPTTLVQTSLDRCAELANVLIVVSAGNSQQTSRFPVQWSQYVANGLAVGATTPCAKTMTGFSSRGPMDRSGTKGAVPPGYERQFPDLVATGSQTLLPHFIDESSSKTLLGTSFAAPHVAGAGFLYLAGHDTSTATPRTALMARAALLATAQDIRLQNAALFRGPNPPLPEDVFGSGYLRTDHLTAYASSLALTVKEYVVAPNTTPPRQTLNVVAGRSYAVAIAWNRTDFSVRPDWADLDLFVYDAGNRVLARSISKAPGASKGRRTWERVRFRATSTGKVQVAVVIQSRPKGTSVRYAQASIVVPTATRARVEDIPGKSNAACRTTGWTRPKWALNTESLIGPLRPKTFSTTDCSWGKGCDVYQPSPGERAFYVGGAAGQTLAFRFYTERACAGQLKISLRNALGKFLPPRTIRPGSTVVATNTIRYTGGKGYISGEIHAPASAPNGMFLVIEFPRKMCWWDARYVYWQAWSKRPWCIPDPKFPRNCTSDTWPFVVWTKNSAGRWFPNPLVGFKSGSWVQIMQWRFAFGWSKVKGPRAVNLTVDAVPRIGASAQLQVEGAGDRVAPMWLIMGLAPIPPIQIGSCAILVRPDLVSNLITNGSGGYATRLPIPLDLSLAGKTFDLQAIVLDWNLPRPLFRASNAKRVVLGF